MNKFVVISFLSFGLLSPSLSALAQTPAISYLIPDIGSPGMNTYVEIVAPYNANGRFGTDGAYSNNPSDQVRLVCTNPADTSKLTIGPIVVSWSGRVISTQIIVSTCPMPNSTQWNQVGPEFSIPLNVIVNGIVSNSDTFFIVLPNPPLVVSGGGVLGSGGQWGTRSKRGALIFDSISLGSGTYTVSTSDCDPMRVGNQGYLPSVILSKGSIMLASGTMLSGSAIGKNAGPGGGGGSMGDGPVIYPGGDGFVGGSPGESGNGAPCSGTGGTGTGGIGDVNAGGIGLNQIIPEPSDADPNCEYFGGTGNPFISEGGGVVTHDKHEGDGNGGGFGTPGENGRGERGNYADSGGIVNGNSMLVPLMGGSGGGGGNEFCSCDEDNSTPGAAGGGGGGGLCLFAPQINATSSTFQVNGASGVTGGLGCVNHSSVGGCGSGGGLTIEAKLSSTFPSVSAAGGISSHTHMWAGNGGAGRVRFDGPLINNPSIVPDTATMYRGLSTDTTHTPKSSLTIHGTGDGDSIRIYTKVGTGPWQIMGTVGGYSLNAWTYQLAIDTTKATYVVAMQQRMNPSMNTATLEPSWVMSQAAVNIISKSSSGGASTLTLSHILQSVQDTTCSAKDTAYRLGGTGCPGVMLDSISITGSTAFSIGDTRGTPRSLDSLDSVRLVFTPTPPGTDTSYLHIKYDLGSGSRDTVITLIGHSTHLPSQLTLSPTTQSVVDTSCGPKDTAFRLSGTGCPGVTLTSVSLSGSKAFTLADSRSMPRALDSLDSVRVVFTPTPPGLDTTYLHLQYNLGSGIRDTVITLIGSSKNTTNILSLAPTTESVFDTICNIKDTSFRLGGTGCPGVTLVSATMTGSPAFGIEDARKMPRTLDSLDSVRIAYAPTPPGVDTSYLHLVYNSGNGNHDTTITLIGTLGLSLRAVTLEMSASPETVLATCVPVIIPNPMWVTGCIASGGKLDSAYLTGSPAITISDTRRTPRGLGGFDSVQLQYLPGTTAPDTAILHLAYNLGSGIRDTSIMVIGDVMNPLPPPAILLPASVQSILSKSCGGSDTGLRIGVTGCPLVNGELDSVWLTGSPTMQINDTRLLPRSLAINDSLGVVYAPTGGGSDTAQLHIRYNVGMGEQDTVMTVIGTVASPLLSQPAQMRRESASAYYGGIDSLPLQLDLITPVNFDSLWNLVTDIQGECAFDGSVVSTVQYLPPVPWTLVSFTAHPSSFDFEIKNTTKRAQNPLDLGTILFSPKSSELATTWVTMSELLLRIGNQTNSLCVVDNEDNHWAVKALGIPQSAVAADALPSSDGISIYPNPAGDEVFVQNTNMDATQIVMYDVIGRQVASGNVLPASTGSIDIASLAQGSYVLVCHIGDRVITRRINKVQ